MRNLKLFPKVIVSLFLILLTASLLSAQTVVPSPEDFFGFRMGADYKIASWPQIVNYFKLLDERSDKLRVKTLGETTEGNPFIMVIITSADNMTQLDSYKRIQRSLAKPRGLNPAAARKLAAEGKVVAMISCNIHSTEIASSQMSLELAHQLITDESPRIINILDKVIFLLVPSLNPDGQIMVVDWYNKYLGTEYEGGRMPWLYHKYTGHDDNRDAFMVTQKETKLITRVLYHEWFPEIILDEHQMGSYGARLFVPPFTDPINPNVNPIIWREIALLGARMTMDLEEEGYSGVVSKAIYTAWWEGSFLMTPWWHNMVGLLTEAASVKVATPIFIDKSQLSGGRRGLPEYKPQENFPNPWPGGWWRLRNLVDYELVASFSLLETAAAYKEDFLYNFYLMGKQAIEKGEKEPPFAFLIPPDQRDMITAIKMIETLMLGGVEVHKATDSFTADGITYPAGTYVILMSQPFRAYAKDMLERQEYPDIRLYPEGPPQAPYDYTGWTLPLQMGVKTVTIKSPFRAELAAIKEAEYPEGVVSGRASYAYVFSHSTNNSFTAVNRLLKDGYQVYWAKEPLKFADRSFEPGAVIVPVRKGIHQAMASIAKELRLNIYAANKKISGEGYLLKPLKLGLYQPWTANMDEGWTRWLLEQFEFPYKNIHNAEMRTGNLRDRYDVIIIPDDSPQQIITGRRDERPDRPYTPLPSPYEGGIGNEGVANLKSFVEAGGTLITFDSASNLPIESFGLPVKNVLKEIPDEEFFCPGSLLEVEVNNTQPIAFGMGEKAAACFVDSPAFALLPSFDQNAKVILKYPSENPLLSGWILGEEKLFDRAALVEVENGKGRIVLIGFRCQNRAQPHGTFKLLFNSLYYGPAKLSRLP